MDAQNSKFVPKFSQNLVFLTKNFLTRRKLSDTFLTANNLGWATVAASPPLYDTSVRPYSVPVLDPGSGRYDSGYDGARCWALSAGTQSRPYHQFLGVFCRRVRVVDDVLQYGRVVVARRDPGQIYEVSNARHHAYIKRRLRTTCTQRWQLANNFQSNRLVLTSRKRLVLPTSP